jgi:hypothetical protein
VRYISYLLPNDSVVLYRNKEVPQPFLSIPQPHELVYLNDILAYDTQNLSWHGLRARGISNIKKTLKRRAPDDLELYERELAKAEEESKRKEQGMRMNDNNIDTNESQHISQEDKVEKNNVEENKEEEELSSLNDINELPIVFPEGRYGHIACALDDNRMFIFGGRGVGGRILNDSWIYHYNLDRWELIQHNEALKLPLPTPRFFAACVSIRIPPPSKARSTSGLRNGLKETDRDVYLFGGKYP